MKKPPLIPSLIVIFFVVLMTNLGFWQLRRAHEKEQLLELLADDQITLISQKEQIKQLPQYANVILKGHYLAQPQLLLDNQVNNGQQGLHVFTPFKLDDLNITLMVNRGWLAKAEYQPQDLQIAEQTTSIAGKLNLPPQVGIQLGEIELTNKRPQQLITYYDKQKISAFLHQSLCQSLDCIVSDKILLLKQDQQNGFKRDWNPIIMPPAKHVAYAVQWFGMTLVLIIIFIYWLRKLTA